jgi:hypothetical protein
MMRMLRRCAVAAFAVTLAGAAFLPGSSRADPPGVVPANEILFGHTYGDWAAQWWEWALSMPAAANPLLDAPNTDCSTGRSEGAGDLLRRPRGDVARLSLLC